jgi:hypothetical protein
MRIYAHRGNLDGVSPEENSPALIRRALEEGFGVEVDLWEIDGAHFLGHDAPTYPVDLTQFDLPGIVFHLKTPHVPALRHADAFAIDNDRYSLTLRGALWTNYGQPAGPAAIVCAPELVANSEPLEAFVGRSARARGICTDFPRKVMRILEDQKGT